MRISSPLRRCVSALAATIALGATLGLAACASTPPPNEQMEAATDAVQRAFDAGAQKFAPAELGAARDRLHRATVAMIAKDHHSARLLAEQAERDALLAQARSESARAGQLR